MKHPFPNNSLALWPLFVLQKTPLCKSQVFVGRQTIRGEFIVSSFFPTCCKPVQGVIRAIHQISIKIKKQEVFCTPAQQPHYDISFDSSVTPYCTNFIHQSLSFSIAFLKAFIGTWHFLSTVK